MSNPCIWAHLLQFLLNQNKELMLQQQRATANRGVLPEPVHVHRLEFMCIYVNTINAEMNLQQSDGTGKSYVSCLSALLSYALRHEVI